MGAVFFALRLKKRASQASALACKKTILSCFAGFERFDVLRDNHAENAGRRQLRTAHVIVIEQAAGRIADGVEIADRMIFRVKHFAFGINQRAAEGGRHAALERDNIEGRRINDRSLVTGVGRRELARITAGNGLVEVLDGLLQRLGIDAGRFGGFFERLVRA